MEHTSRMGNCMHNSCTYGKIQTLGRRTRVALSGAKAGSKSVLEMIKIRFMLRVSMSFCMQDDRGISEYWDLQLSSGRNLRHAISSQH